MSKFSTFIATEDLPSLTLVEKILSEKNRFYITNRFPTSGFGFLKKNMKKFNKLAKHYVVTVITDLDNNKLDPIKFKQKWFSSTYNSGLIFELAIVEIESWILADYTSFSEYFSISLPPIKETDNIDDPKQKLFELVKKSKSKDIRDAILPTKGATIGPEYNITIVDYISKCWDLNRAKKNSSSLKHFNVCLNSFTDSSGNLIKA